MPHHTIKRLILSLVFFICTLSFGAMLRPAMAQCETPDDARIVSEIIAKIGADKSLAPQRSHINVVSVNGAVKLQGWTDTRSDYDKLYSYAFKAMCVKMVNVNLFSETPPPADSPARSAVGCGTGMKACGDVCIPTSDPCSMTVEKSQ